MSHRIRPHRGVVLALLVQGALAGCPVALPNERTVGFHCSSSDDCAPGLYCSAQQCVAPSTADAAQTGDAIGATDRAPTDGRRDSGAVDRPTADAGRADALHGDAPRTDSAANDLARVDAPRSDGRLADGLATDRLLRDGTPGDQPVDRPVTDTAASDLATADTAAADQLRTDGATADQVAADSGGTDIAASDRATPVDPCRSASPTAIHAAVAPTVDSQPADWSGACRYTLRTPDNWGEFDDQRPADYARFAADFALQWRSDALYLWIELDDDIHANSQDNEMIWDADSVQVAFDLDCSGGTGYSAGDFEYGWALANNLQRSYRWYPDYSSPALSYLVRRDGPGQKTYYEAALTSADFGGHAFTAGSSICFSLLINESDSASRVGWLEWGSGIAMNKVPDQFRRVQLAP